MSQFNKIIIEGNLVRDPEVFGDEKKITKFSIANNTGFGEYKSANFFECIAFGKKGEVIAEYCQKGKAIQVEGKMIQRDWEDKEGKKRTSYQIEVFDFVFRSSKEKEEPKY